MEVEANESKPEELSPQEKASEQQAQRVKQLPPTNIYKMQTFPHSGKTVEALANEIGDDALRYILQMPNTHQDDKAMIKNFLERDGVPF